MKFCSICGEQIGTKDGENKCEACDLAEDGSKSQKLRRNAARREREQVLRDCGLVKVKGQLGGVYWE